MADLTRDDIDDILRLIDGSDFDELKLQFGDLKLELRRKGAATSHALTPPDQPAKVEPSPPASQATSASPSMVPTEPVAPTEPAASAGQGTAVPAPLLGTFYHAPKPGEPPFVRVGDTVAPDSVVGIIEVMKLMNTVTAGLSGTVVAICAENGQLVEHGQAIIRVQTA